MTTPKRYITRARAHIQKQLPKGAKVCHIYPRAYCVAVPALACAVFATTYEDDQSPFPDEIQAVVIHYFRLIEGAVLDTAPPAVGRFRTLVYIWINDYGMWYSMAPIPFDL